MKVLNAFSLNMIDVFPVSVKVVEITPERVRTILAYGFESAVGHADTAAVFSDALGVEIPFARTNVKLVAGDTVIVGQYSGPRLPEGCTSLPEGAAIKWLLVSVKHEVQIAT